MKKLLFLAVWFFAMVVLLMMRSSGIDAVVPLVTF